MSTRFVEGIERAPPDCVRLAIALSKRATHRCKHGAVVYSLRDYSPVSLGWNMERPIRQTWRGPGKG
ncbi:MAG: hypothetical protein AABY22_35590, partial [Nanoarchaeota archaeon]